MKTIIMTGWQEGMQKVSLTKLQVQLLGLSLKESKENVDKLLGGTEITIDTNASATAEKFVREAKEIGVSCKIVASQVYKEA